MLYTLGGKGSVQRPVCYCDLSENSESEGRGFPFHSLLCPVLLLFCFSDLCCNTSLNSKYLFTAVCHHAKEICIYYFTVFFFFPFFPRQGFSVALEPILELTVVDQAGLEPTEILPLPPECWD